MIRTFILGVCKFYKTNFVYFVFKKAFRPASMKWVLVFLFMFVVTSSLTCAQDVKPGADSPIRFGNPNAQFKLEVFVDFQCGACVAFNEKLKTIKEKYPSKIEITIRHFPLRIPAQDKAFISAKAVEAAYKQGKGDEMINLILAKQKSWMTNADASQMFAGYAKKLGLNIKRYNSDFDSQETLARVEQDYDRATSLQLDAVPSVILNGKLLGFAESFNLEEIISKGK